MTILYNNTSGKMNTLLTSGFKYFLVVFLFSVLSLSKSFAQDILTAWDFDGNGGSEATVTAGTFATNVSVSAPSGVISRGSGINPATNSNRFNANEWITTAGDNSNQSYAITNNKYMEWSIAPASGYKLNIDSVVFNWQRSDTGPDSLTMRSNQDAYTADLYTTLGIGNSSTRLKAVLSGIVNVQGTLTFRLYGYGATGTTGSGGFEGTADDLIIYGNVVPIQDTDSEINAPITQITGSTISSTVTSVGSAMDVFKFNIKDQGTSDGQATKVTNIRITPSASNTADWTDNIQGVTLNNGSSVTIGSPVITDAYIDIPITSGNLDIADNSNNDVILAVYLNTLNIADGKIMSFFIDASNHGCVADEPASQFISTFPNGDITSNNFTIGVVATKLQFFQMPTDVNINDVMSPSVSVAFTDANGNIDLGYETDEISVSANGVTLSGSSTTLQDVQSDGLATFNDLAFSTSGTGTLTAHDANSILPATDITSISFDVIPILSIIQAVTSSEASSISSLINDATITSVTEGEQVWQLDLFDGDGTNPDNDGFPTNYTSIRIDQHVANGISNWQSAILAVGYFDGSTHIPGIVIINQTNISFTPTNPISVPDGGAVGGSKKTISVRISLQTTLPVGTDGSKFVFEMSEGGVTVGSAATSSQLGTFTVASGTSGNAISVVATKLVFVQQPADVVINQTMTPSVTVGFADANDNIDTGFETEEIEITANSVTLIGAHLEEVLADGLSTFSSLSFSTSGTGTLTASDINNILGTSETVTSSSFEVIAIADHVTFVNVPSSGQINQTINSFTVEARRPDESVDTNYTDDITISINTGPGNISGTQTQTAVAGEATFDDIAFDASGNYTLAANDGTLAQGISASIAIIGADDSVFPNGRETINFAITSPSTIAEHELGNGFINTGVLTFSGGGATNEADIRNTSISSGYTNASGGSNVFFTSSSGDYGFAMEGIDASTYTDLTLQFAVRKEDASPANFATLAVEYWDGDSWENITISDYPTSTDGTGWTLLNSVTLPATAEIATLGLRWVKSGAISCRLDDVSLTGTAKVASNLIVATINGGLPPVVGIPFNVDVNVQDGSGSPANVLEDTNIELTLNTGTGVLGGTLTTTITTGTNSSTISGVTYTVSESGVILTAGRTSGDNLQSGNSSTFSVLASEPLTSASSISIDDKTTTSIDLSWTIGDGSERIVIVKEGAAVDQDPVDAATYTANTDFTLGEDIGNGNIVVFAGSGNSVSITNLQSGNTTYHFAVYEYNGLAGLENYKQLDPAIGSALTSCDDPATQASALTFSNTSQSAVDLSWTDGDGTGRIVLMNSINTFTDPVDGDDSYVADPSWNNAGQQIVYFSSGTGVPVTVANLSASTTYYFRVYEYNCSGTDINYKTDVDNTASMQTYLLSQNFTTCPPAGWLSVLINGNNWACGSGYASASGIGGSVATETWYITPSRDFSLVSNAGLSFDSWTSGSDDSHPKLEVKYSSNYAGSGNPNVATWTDLTFNSSDEDTQVWTASGIVDLSAITGNAYVAFKYNSSGTSVGTATEWRIDNVEIYSQPCATPTLATTNLSFANVLQNTMTLNWVKGDGIGRIVIASINPITFTPSNGVEYTANADYSLGTDLGNGDKIVYSGGTAGFDLSGLSSLTTYYFAVYEFSCNGTNRTYVGTALTGSQATLDPNASDIIAETSYTYNSNIDYTPYSGINNLTTTSTIDVFKLAMRDEGFVDLGGTSDGNDTELTSITFSTNGSTSIKGAAIFDGSLRIAEIPVNGATSFTLSSFENSLIAPSDDSIHFTLRVTFVDGVLDNEQIVFTVTEAIANPSTSPFFQSDAGAAESISTGGTENKVIVTASSLNIVQGPTHSFPTNEVFTIEVEAIDSRNSRDLDKSLTISSILGSGILSSTSGLTKTTTDSTALWTDLIYDTSENTEFEISDGGVPLTVSTGILKSEPRISIFTFTGANGDETTYAPDSQPLNLTISNISRGANINAFALSDAFNATSWPLAIDDVGSYYEVTLSAATGYTFDISSVEFDHRRSASGPDRWEGRTSEDGFTGADTGVTTGDGVWNRNEDLPLDFTGQTSLTFRIYAYNASSGSGTWAIDNIEFFGTINDVLAPSFTATYPQYDSVAVDGFDLLVNLDEAATAYYIVQNPSTSAPSRAQVIAGLDGADVAAEAGDPISVTVADSTFNERVSGLNSLSVYDVYFVLDDGTNQSDTTTLLANIPLSDVDTDLASTTQPVGSTILSTSDNSADSVAIFSFSINDLGTNDGSPTHVTKLVFNSTTGNTVADWSTVIGGVRLYNDTEVVSIPISGSTIGASSIEIDLAVGDLTIEDGVSSNEQITLSIWLTNSVTDNEALAFEIGGATHGNLTHSIGSQFNSTLTTLASNTYTIQVIADRLSLSAYPTNVSTTTDFTVTVLAIDENGNQDLGNSTTVDLSRGLGSGNLTSGGNPPQATMTGGTVTWIDVQYSGVDEFFTIIASDNGSTILSDTTTLIQVGSASDLIVTTGNTVTISSNQTYGNVTVETGATLTLNSGITLTITSNLTVDGTYNDLGGTTLFGGSSVQSIISNVTDKTVSFYNITISNATETVTNTIHINLINTLKLNSNTNFDADGTDNRNFTLISTSSATARISTIEDDATLSGNVVWQRSLRTGPAGWRYIGTPIKSQTLANISDDVWIQGVTEIHSWHWTNIGTYSEPTGTTGENGVDGWVDFTSTANPLVVGVGMKLWQWDNNYATEQVIENKGLPVIGNGLDNIAGAGEEYTFPTASFTPSSFDGGGWNFYANPYPSEVDWNNVSSTDFDARAVYIWNPNTQQYGTYSASTQIGTGGVTQYLSAGQGFFVKANSGSSQLKMSEASKSSADGNSFLREAEESFPKMMVKILSGNGKQDETAITFTNFSTNGYDPEFDALKLSGGWVNLSSKLENDKLIVINAMGESRGVQSVKLNVDPYYFGNYSLEFPTIEAFSEGAIMRLKDNYLDKTVVINQASKYDFTIVENIAQTYGGDRFEIQFVEPVNFRFDEIEAKAGREFVMPVYADQIADIMSAKLALGWDESELTFVGVEDVGEMDMNDFDLNNVESGSLRLHSSYTQPLELPDDTQLFSIRFLAKNETNATLLRFEDETMDFKAIDDIDMPFNTSDVMITILQNKFVAGKVATYTGEPVDDVNVLVNGDDNFEKSTDNLGDYSLDTHEQSSYTLSASRLDDLKLNEAVTTIDIIKSRRHILQVEEFVSPYQSVAADVNLSKSITALDLTQMRKVVLGIDEGFTDGLNWLFIPDTYDLTNDPFSFETSVDIALTDQDLNLDFVAVKIGDVNNSWVNQNAGRTSSGAIELSLEHLKLTDDFIEIPVVASDFYDISGYQFSITWDAHQLEYYGIENVALEGYFNEQLIDDGILTSMWDEFNGKSIDLDDGVVLFILKFKALDEKVNSLVELNSTITQALAFDSKLNSMSIKSVAANVNLEALRNGSMELYQNVPNPFEQNTEISFKITKPGLARISVINLLGETIYMHEQNYDVGIYSINWDKNQGFIPVSPGVYLYRLESNGQHVVRKMLIE